MIDLPAPLPPGETILWEGAPRPWSFLRQVVHPQLLIIYVAVLVVWCVVAGVHSGAPAAAVLAAAKYSGLALVALLILSAIARLQAGSTDYVITNRRVIITFGAALGKTLQIPFASIQAASLRAHGDGTGDLVLTLVPEQKVSYLLLWPNVRPWPVEPAQPMLRAIRSAGGVAEILGRALAGHDAMMPQQVAAVDPVPQSYAALASAA